MGDGSDRWARLRSWARDRGWQVRERAAHSWEFADCPADDAAAAVWHDQWGLLRAVLGADPDPRVRASLLRADLQRGGLDWDNLTRANRRHSEAYFASLPAREWTMSPIEQLERDPVDPELAARVDQQPLWVRQALAGNPSLPAEGRDRLLSDPICHVRSMNLIFELRAGDAAREARLLPGWWADPCSSIRRMAIESRGLGPVFSVTGETSLEVLETAAYVTTDGPVQRKLACHELPQVRAAVAANAACGPELLVWLAGDDDTNVWLAAKNNPGWPQPRPVRGPTDDELSKVTDGLDLAELLQNTAISAACECGTAAVAVHTQGPFCLTCLGVAESKPRPYVINSIYVWQDLTGRWRKAERGMRAADVETLRRDQA
jgi:hypothetical protein